ncbi:hypothetical protein AB0D67_10140 [Streptosporangium sp. NPDC048047]|uniref:hypothetical protein n=1 Tax=Streptosporangium sp. NPDC048047 TaxID=3155748 RepID=UPI00342E39E6
MPIAVSTHRKPIRRTRNVLAAALAAGAVAMIFAPQPASADGVVRTYCESGRACAIDTGPSPDKVWNALWCGFHNMGDEGFNDKTDRYQTSGNRIQFGNYKGSGDTHTTSSFVWDSILPANSSGSVPANKYDAMWVYC